MSEEAIKPARKRWFLRPLYLSLSAFVVVVAVGLAIAVPAMARESHREAMALNAQADTDLLVSASAVYDAQEVRNYAARDQIAEFANNQLIPAHDVAREKLKDEAEAELKAFTEALDELNSLIDGESGGGEPLGFDADEHRAEIYKMYLEADESELEKLRAAGRESARVLRTQASRLSERTDQLEQQAVEAAKRFEDVMVTAADAAGDVLNKNAKASKETKQKLEDLVELLGENSELPLGFGAEVDAAQAEAWLQATDAISKYPEAAKKVQESHKKATAPKPKPKPKPTAPSGGSGSGSSGGSGGSGGGNSGTCTWMEWGPLAPYWVWGPCSDMPK